MKNKRTLIIVGAIVLLVGIIIGIICLTKFGAGKQERVLKEYTKEFYSYYYDENNKDNKAKEYLAQFKENGLSISLGNMEVYLNVIGGAEKDFKVFDKCDVDKTYVNIFPQEPYTKTSFKMETHLSCEK